MTNNSLNSMMNEQTLKYVKKRHKANRRFQFYGKIAVIFSVSFLCILLYSIISKGYTAFIQHELQLELTIDQKLFEGKELSEVNYDKIIRQALKERFPEAASKRRNLMMLYQLQSSEAPRYLKNYLSQNPSSIGKKITLWLPLTSKIDMYLKGHLSANAGDNSKMMHPTEKAWIDELVESKEIRSYFNHFLFTRADSRNPEIAGIWGSMVGSILTIACCMLVAFPIGVMTAIYLEEFAPKNKITDLIEVNLNNLAAVPSIVFGLLGLAIYLNFFGLPRSAALVGGLTLALMVLPTIVITARNALNAVPPSIRDGALALGASPVQVVWHHTLPLAMPGIMTGTILSIARAIGETAPLLMVGMMAFVADVPSSILEPATVMPVQIYLWSDTPEMGYVERTSAAIMILLLILLFFNGLAAYLRKKFEIKW